MQGSHVLHYNPCQWWNSVTLGDQVTQDILVYSNYNVLHSGLHCATARNVVTLDSRLNYMMICRTVYCNPCLRQDWNRSRESDWRLCYWNMYICIIIELLGSYSEEHRRYSWKSCVRMYCERWIISQWLFIQTDWVLSFNICKIIMHLSPVKWTRLCLSIRVDIAQNESRMLRNITSCC